MEKLTNIGVIKDLLKKHNFRFSKKMGQNFLINPSVCPRMAQACGANKSTGVIEIGPGIGVLTKELSKQAGKVVAIELDKALIPVLNETLKGLENVKIITGDALKIDFEQLIIDEFSQYEKVAICANLPYYITSPIIMHLLESKLDIDNITVMVQKEAAQRLCAAPGTRECGAVSFAVSYYSNPQILFDVSRGSFIPSPRVDSSVIKLDVLEKPAVSVKDEKMLFKLIRAGFNQRRKTLANALAGGGFEKSHAVQMVKGANLDANIRAEKLTLEDFAKLTQYA